MRDEKEINKLFPDEREKNKDKDILRQAQLISLRILTIVDYICKKNNINYWLDSGTLLGAVRHKGFIPWDDDIDIAMTRDDYEKFVSIAKDELPDDLFMQNLMTTKFAANPWTQIKDRKSKLVLDENAQYHQGIYIDIFPFDIYSTNKFISFFCERLYKQMYIKVQAINAPLKKPFLTKSNVLKNIIKILLKIIFFPFAIFNYKVISKLNIKTREKRIKKMKNNEKLTYGIGTDVLNWDKIFKYESIFPLKKLNFENISFPVPNDCKSYLTVLYGSDFMELPPASKRVYHNKEIKTTLTEKEEKEENNGFYY